jgi:hypothetical protein
MADVEPRLPDLAELVDFLSTLRVHGVRVAAPQVRDLGRILSALRTGLPETALSDLPFAAAAILAKSPVQQSAVQTALVGWMREKFEERPGIPTVPETDVDTGGLIDDPPSRKPLFWWVLGSAILVVAICLLTIASLLGSIHYVEKSSPVEIAKVREPIPPERLARQEVRWAAAGIAALATLWVLAAEARRRRDLLRRRAKVVVRDVLDRGAAPFGQWLYRSAEVKRIGQQLQGWGSGRFEVLDERRTIDGTILRGGLLFLAFKPARQRPVYGMLVQEESRHDHLARLGENLAHSLREEGVQLELSFCSGSLFDSGDPDRSYSRMEMTALRDQPESRLVVVGDGRALMSPGSGVTDPAIAREASAWEAKVLLSTQPIEAWGEMELALLDDGWNLATARMKGLAALARRRQDLEAGSLLEGRKGIPQLRVTMERTPLIEEVAGQVRTLQKSAASTHVAGELGNLASRLVDDTESSVARLLALRARGLVTLSTELLASLAAIPTDGLAPRDDRERLDELHAQYRALRMQAEPGLRDLLGAVVAYRALSKLEDYRFNRSALSAFDPRLAGQGADATVADFALAVVAGALASGKTVDLLEGALTIPMATLAKQIRDPGTMLPDGAPLVGRTALRDFARHLTSRVSSRVLFCLGGPGSGKSTSREYLEQISANDEGFPFVCLSTEAEALAETERRIQAAVSPPDRGEPAAAFFRSDRTRWRKGEAGLLFLDDIDRFSPPGKRALGSLIRNACDYSSDLRICVTGPTATLPDEALVVGSIKKFVAIEYLSLGSSALDPESAIFEAWLASIPLITPAA